MNGIKGQDVVILLKLASLQDAGGNRSAADRAGHEHPGDPYSVRNLETQLGISKSEVNSSIQRSLSSGLALRSHATGQLYPNRRNLHNFILHGLKFVFPAKPGGMTRGVPTAFAAPMLHDQLGRGGDYIHVWPFAAGHMMGQAVTPLFKSVPEAVASDARLYEYLALVDAIRLGGQREWSVAAERLSERLLSS
jgi:hypothetical protein